MSQASRLPYTRVSTVSLAGFRKKMTAVKQLLNNETIQKIVLFTTILGLLLVAANLDSIL